MAAQERRNIIIDTDGGVNDEQERRKIIIDTDGGVDDAQAIFMMLDSIVYDVIGITCVRVNSAVDQVVRNVLKILTAADQLNIPVFRGCDCSVLGEVS
ncbi:uridine nucleosidase 2 [Mizuhopecten yessoensis]|uniref:Uridine nucleosidase 2 n=1 Tax=Mizuhopecten yessoensis TaxID=6573 RepID=A0A210PUI5_MIZYE|nr:uridine nucleosidase 2 [Mizuhopecten yessoensis]